MYEISERIITNYVHICVIHYVSHVERVRVEAETYVKNTFNTAQQGTLVNRKDSYLLSDKGSMLYSIY